MSEKAQRAERGHRMREQFQLADKCKNKLSLKTWELGLQSNSTYPKYLFIIWPLQLNSDMHWTRITPLHVRIKNIWVSCYGRKTNNQKYLRRREISHSHKRTLQITSNIVRILNKVLNMMREETLRLASKSDRQTRHSTRWKIWSDD